MADEQGTVTHGVVPAETRGYSYDANGRLLTASGPWGSGTYIYDALGNVRGMTHGSVGTSIAYDANNRVGGAAGGKSPIARRGLASSCPKRRTPVLFVSLSRRTARAHKLFCRSRRRGRSRRGAKTERARDMTNPTGRRRRIVSRVLFRSSAPFSHVVVHAGTGIVSGLIAQDRTSGAVVGRDAGEQMRVIFENLTALLAEADAAPADILATRLYLVDYADFEAVNEVYRKYLSAPYPARTTLQAAALPLGARVQLDATFAASDDVRGG